jgi:hypothetical protein
MIEAISSAFLFVMFAVWTRNGFLNAIVKLIFLGLALGLAWDAAQEFGYVFRP